MGGGADLAGCAGSSHAVLAAQELHIREARRRPQPAHVPWQLVGCQGLAGFALKEHGGS